MLQLLVLLCAEQPRACARMDTLSIEVVHGYGVILVLLLWKETEALSEQKVWYLKGAALEA